MKVWIRLGFKTSCRVDFTAEGADGTTFYMVQINIFQLRNNTIWPVLEIEYIIFVLNCMCMFSTVPKQTILKFQPLKIEGQII